MEKEGLTYFTAGLALMSTMIGGGISGLPYSYFNTGLTLGLIIHLFMAALTAFSCYLYLTTKDILKLQSISEIAFKLQGRCSIFFVNIVLIILALGLMVIYFDLFGQICAGLFRDIVSDPNSGSFFAKKYFYVLVIGFLTMLFIHQKEIKELKILSIILFFCIAVMILVLFI